MPHMRPNDLQSGRYAIAIDSIKSLATGILSSDANLALLRNSGRIVFLAIPDLTVVKVSLSSDGYSLESAKRELEVENFLYQKMGCANDEISNWPNCIYGTGDVIVTLHRYFKGKPCVSRLDTITAWLALKKVHEALSECKVALPSFIDELDTVKNLIRGEFCALFFSPSEIFELLHIYSILRTRIQNTASQLIPVHGDPNAGNVLMTQQGAVWLDFECVCLAPLEWDVAVLPVDASKCFGLDENRLATFRLLRQLCYLAWVCSHTEQPMKARECIVRKLFADCSKRTHELGYD